MRPALNKIVIYLISPILICLPMAGMYFSGNIVLQRIICPKLPPLPPDSWREYGLLENVQNLILLVMLVTVVAAIFRKVHLRERIAWGVLALFVAFIFLEELDYGVHWYRLAMVETREGLFTPAKDWDQALLATTDTTAPNVNLHNQGFTDAFKILGDTVLVGFFLLIPWGLPWLLRMARKVPLLQVDWLRYVAADRYAVLGLVAMLIMRFIVHGLAERGAGILTIDGSQEPGSLESNLSEFREVTTYYLFTVYLAGIVFFRKSPGDA